MKRTAIKSIIVILTITISLTLTVSAEASSVYVAGEKYIYKYDDTGNYTATNFSSTQNYVSGIADDPVNNQLYYRSSYNIWKYIKRDNDPESFDPNYGDTSEILYQYDQSHQLSHGSMDYDSYSSDLFYLERTNYYGNPQHHIRTLNTGTGSGDTLYTVNEKKLVGWTGCCGYERPVYQNIHNLSDMALDSFNDYIYWTDSTAGSVNRLNLGTGTAEALYTGLSNPTGIAVDGSAGRVFWTEKGSSANGYDSLIQVANTTGTGSPFSLLSFDGTSGDTYYGSIDVDPTTGKIYFIDHTTGFQSGYSGTVRTMSYSGQNLQDFTTPSDSRIYGNIVDVSTTVVPEPVSSTLFFVGAGMLGFRRFRKTKE